MIAYVLTTGDYSDYGVCGVYLDEELAKQVAKRNKWDIEEYEVDVTPAGLAANQFRWNAFWYPRGDSPPASYNTGWHIKPAGDRFYDMDEGPRPSGRISDGQGRRALEASFFAGELWARDEAHARRQAEELRAFMLAEQVTEYKGLVYKWHAQPEE